MSEKGEKFEIPIQLRLPQSIVGRADALLALLLEDPALTAMGRVTRTSVLRLAILRGLEVLENERWK